MNKDQVKGRIAKAKGKVRELAGMIAGNKTLEEKGRIGKTLGSVRARYGDLKEGRRKGS
ncbi:MAG TPA: CsbD family protein [Burkholderiales bacterium]|nr:CsbD family protein [Burkholderiales bacterium]